MDCISDLPVYEITTTANVSDSAVALEILADTHSFLPITECTFLADKGYDVQNIYNQVKELYDGERFFVGFGLTSALPCLKTSTLNRKSLTANSYLKIDAFCSSLHNSNILIILYTFYPTNSIYTKNFFTYNPIISLTILSAIFTVKTSTSMFKISSPT